MNADFIAEIAARTIRNQSFYRKYANTINSFIGSLAAVLVFLAGYWATTGQAPQSEMLLAFLAPFASALATRLTKNAVTESSKQALINEAMRPATTNGLPVYRGETSAVN